ncbi:class I SAM-dependent methyltransferase [Microbispora amethystogenes]|uniref:class I SAM-dependent methyltransferase n=1 Tax=Microbispora amethystogenes TaxID=1427754 RepID=UPI00340D124A
MTGAALADGQTVHDALAVPTAEEAVRQNEIWTLKRKLAEEIAPELRRHYETEIVPCHVAEHGAPPADRRVIASLMAPDPRMRLFSALRRRSQEQMWDLVLTSASRQLDRLLDLAAGASAAPGSLDLDPALEIPRYLRAVDIHCMPTGYYREFAPDDVTAGALYDRGVYVYAGGQLGGLNDDKGWSVIRGYLDRHRPEWTPARILDMGCSVGHSTIPYTLRYPAAEVHAIDVAAPMLRYARARAAALGAPVHFAQRDATATGYPDASFDLVVSHILLHETSVKAVQQVLSESYRLLRPGGLMIHAEYPPFDTMDPFAQFLVEWDTTNNNEPFWSKVRTLDLVAMAATAGFDPATVHRELIPTGRRLTTGQSGGTSGGGRMQVLAASR